ncbi:MAG: endonuclease/exonuclease/phosphatase family protein [Faecousia sp.]
MDDQRNNDLPEEQTPPDGNTIFFTTPTKAQWNEQELEAPVRFDTDAYDLEDALPEGAQELPLLFPEQEEPSEEKPCDEGEPTRVERPKKRKKSTARKVLRVFAVIGKLLLGVLLAVAVLAAGLVGYLTVTEYNPAHAELAERGANNALGKLTKTNLRLVTFNTGFGGLGEDADFFMDGGEGVNPTAQETVERNMIGIEEILSEQDADILLLQEVDTDSKRSFHLNQWLQYEYDLADYETRFAMNYSCDYVPYPLNDRIGEVHSGIATYSRFDISSATRYSLPCPFSWPTRVANLKRCMLVTRTPIENKEQELVIVNFHLEAYDDGEGRTEQFEQLMEFIQAEYEKGNYVIAGGDFNQALPDTLERYPMKATSEWTPNVLEELLEGWQYAYDESVPTCRLLNQPYQPSSEKTQYYVIDGFIVSPNVSVDRIETLDEGFVYSDHNPVVLDITLE